MTGLTKQTTSVWNTSKINVSNDKFKNRFIGFIKPDQLGWRILVVNLIIITILFLLTHILIFFPSLKIPCVTSFEETNHLQNLFTLHAAITALIFPMVFFIAERLRSSEKDEGRVKSGVGC